jgi:hypothetical protein
MGAEGLHEMRMRIWTTSANALLLEAQDYLTRAWYIEQVEGVLGWASYCGDIAFAVASGRILGTGAALILGLLKPVLVDAMTAYADGKDMEWWAIQQLKLTIGVIEGQATDPDLLALATGKHKAAIWVAFLGYTFAKNWALDPEHRISVAMETTCKMARDQAIISFLRWATGPSVKTTEGAWRESEKPERPRSGVEREYVPRPGEKEPQLPVQRDPRPVNLREGPTTAAKAVTLLKDLARVRAEALTLTQPADSRGQNGQGWYQVSAPQAGWVRADFLSDAQLGNCEVRNQLVKSN